MRGMTKRLLLTWLLLAAAAGGAESKAEALARLKREFPAHLAGPITEQTDAHIATCYRHWRRLADGLKVETLAENIVQLRAMLHDELMLLEVQRGDAYRVLKSDTKAALRKNQTWLRTKVSPWVDRVAAVQRGR